MKLKIFVIAAAIAALMSPLVALADALPAIPFAELSSISHGISGTAKNAKFTLTDLNSATKKVTQKYALTSASSTNNNVDASSSATFIYDKSSIVTTDMMKGLLKISLDEVVDYDNNNQAHLTTVVLRNGPASRAFSGQGRVELDIPGSNTFNNAAFADFTGVTSKPARPVTQTIMSGSVGVTANVKRDDSIILTVGPIKPAFATIQTVMKNYSGTATANPGIHILSDTTQNLNASGAVLPGETIQLLP
jgi:hypothetical protein